MLATLLGCPLDSAQQSSGFVPDYQTAESATVPIGPRPVVAYKITTGEVAQILTLASATEGRRGFADSSHLDVAVLHEAIPPAAPPTTMKGHFKNQKPVASQPTWEPVN